MSLTNLMEFKKEVLDENQIDHTEQEK
jgi:hypothetical protein